MSRLKESAQRLRQTHIKQHPAAIRLLFDWLVVTA
jgi:hypothetical protein